MTEHEQHVAIAKWMGYVVSHGGDFEGTHVAQGSTVMKMPEYTGDLNAMHEAEAQLTFDERVRFVDCLRAAVKDSTVSEHFSVEVVRLTFSTAAQRAEALLRTLNLWKETAP